MKNWKSIKPILITGCTKEVRSRIKIKIKIRNGHQTK
jgi:hypothetical protein